MLLWADTGLFFACQVRYLYEGRKHLLVLFKIRATPLDTIRSVMIIRGPEQSDQSAIEQLFAALLTAYERPRNVVSQWCRHHIEEG